MTNGNKYSFSYVATTASSVGNFQCFSGKLIPFHTQCDGYRDCSGKNWEDEPESCGESGYKRMGLLLLGDPGETESDQQIMTYARRFISISLMLYFPREVPTFPK